MKRYGIWSLALALSLLVHARLRAESAPVRGAHDGRIRTAVYDPQEVYRLRGVVGYQIDLQFEKGETFAGLGAGDIDALGYVGQDNHLFLKPKAARVATNLTVLTNRREYQFDYGVLSPRLAVEDADVIYVVRFTYPPAATVDLDKAVEKLEHDLDAASAGRVNNVDYWYCGSPGLRPLAASDDGVHTRLRFAANADLPALFVRNDDGSESLLNFSLDAGDIIVHRVARRLILRRGGLTGCIVNQGFLGNGTRLDSGTVTPAVQRAVRGTAP